MSAALWLAWSSSALALNPALDVNQYAHTSWTVRDGFVRGVINAVAQTPDGYLWLGTESGLVRFDGVRTVPWQPPDGQTLPSEWVSSLLVTRDGTLWIGTFKGLLSWKGAVVTRYPRLDGMSIATIVEDRRGTVWVGGGQATAIGRVCSIAVRTGDIHCVGDDGALSRHVGSLFEDSTGNVWVGTQDGLWRWVPEPRQRYVDFSGDSRADAFVELDRHALIIATPTGLKEMADGRVRAYAVAGQHDANSYRLLHDRDGGLWIATYGNGLTHVHGGRTDVFTRADGLSSDYVHGLFEDREGNIWVATSEGLDRFREYAVSTISVKQGLSDEHITAVLPSVDGSMWVGTPRGLDRVYDGRIDHDLDRNIRFLLQDARQRLWVATDREAGLAEHGRFEAITGLPGGEVRGMTVDRDGDVWMANLDFGLFRVHDAHRVERIPWSALGRKDFASSIAADRERGGVWLGFYLGGVAHFADGRIRVSYAASDGLGVGAVNDLRFDRTGSLWAATDGGLSRIKGNRVATLTGRNGLPCDAVHWMREDGVGATWLSSACGLVRVAPGGIDAWAAASDAGRAAERQIDVTVFDASEGVRNRPAVGGYGPKVAASPDGRFWFQPSSGVSFFDPQRVPSNRMPPPVRIEQVTADRKTFEIASAGEPSLRLPPLIRDLQIDYTALSLVAPEKMRFRYWLEGYDREWQDAGTRRQVFYTNLPPRAYRFRVKATNNSGVWNESGAALEFSIAPAYYQTAWFPAVVIGTIAALVWGSHRLRLRVVERHEREITALNERMMKAQEQERIRIAGELHDGVMQQMLSVTMMVGTAKRRMDDPSKAKATLDQIQAKLIQTGADIRQISHGLHPPMLQEAGLPAAVRGYCEQFSAASTIPVSCECDERARDLSRGAALALFRIVQEALGNAAKHARAGQIAVRVARTNGRVMLTVSDDGVGFDTSRLSMSGGLGLVMMRERAAQLNGTFEFSSVPGHGTTIAVVIPFR